MWYLMKPTLKGYVTAAIVIILFLLLGYFIISITCVPKETATAEQVWAVLENQGHKPYDITYQFKELSSVLTKCIAIEEDDLRFEFYVFDNENSAIDLYGNAHSLIVRTKNALPHVVYDQKIANSCIYTLKAKGEYNVAIYVGNTAVYAYCKEENAGKINKILIEIGYLDS